jgi:hypothetical protein
MRFARATCRCGRPIEWKPCDEDLEIDSAVNIEEIEKLEELAELKEAENSEN